MAAPDLIWKNGRFGQTSRTDTWWLEPLMVFLGLSAAVVYITWAAFQGEHYTYGPYLSPFYSPELFGDSEHAWFGPRPDWLPWPAFLAYSPAFLILWGPGLFRFTCYYYRGAYYKAFWADPPACGVSEPRSSYRGEQVLPLILHNVHRYVFYIALLFIVVLTIDVWKGMWFPNPQTGGLDFGLGLGTLFLALNTSLLAGYTFGCHCSRHLCGGGYDRISEHPLRSKLYRLVSWLNANHKKFAWASLGAVIFADLYIRLCSMGIWSDWRIF